MVPSECIQIKKELGKAYVGAGKTKDALETFDECEKLMKGFYLVSIYLFTKHELMPNSA